MNNDYSMILVGFVVGVLFGGLVGLFLMEISYQSDAIESECAQYNPVTGDFEWLEKQ